MSKEYEMVDSLAKQVQILNAGAVQMALHNIKKTKGLTAVISVYDQQKPDHIILDELQEWAEKEGHSEVVDKIVELARDMSWNDESREVKHIERRRSENDVTGKLENESR